MPEVPTTPGAPSVTTAQADGVGVDGRTRPSEDRVAVLPNAVLLLDGATNLLPGLRSGGWYAGELVAALQARLLAAPDAGLAAVLAAAIAGMVAEHGLVPGHSPSATVAMLRWSPTTVDALVLADSPVAVRASSGSVEVLADDRLAGLPRDGGGYRERLADGGGFGAGHAAALRAGAAATARLRNVDGGFWVAEADPAAAERARTARWPRADVHAALLASDGVSCGVDDYGLFDWQGMFGLAAGGGPAAVCAAVRAAERADPHGRRWPRPKVSDDQALAYVELSPKSGRS